MARKRPTLRVLDLCSGTGSIWIAIKRIFGKDFDIEYVSVDNVLKFDPTFCVDIRKWDFKKDLVERFGKGGLLFDIIWSSPPCTHYSLAKSVGVRDFKTADAIVKACWKIIHELDPPRWFMENPSTGYLHKRPFMKKYVRYIKECCYCRYGRDFKKPTHIWTNVGCEFKTCDNDTPCKWKRANNTHPVASQGGPNVMANNGLNSGISRNKAYEIPIGLLRELFTCPELMKEA